MGSTQIVVVGGGYAGCTAANRLARRTDRDDVSITLVNARPDFVERVRLHQQIAGTGDAATPLADLLNPRIRVMVDAVEKIGDGELSLSGGTALPFDRLVYAAGGAPRAPEGTLAVGDTEQAREAQRRLAGLGSGARITVVGGGLTGIETAAEIAEARPDVAVTMLSEAPVAASLHPTARRRVERDLDGLGVTRERGRYAGPGDADLVLWAVATDVSDLAARSGLAVNDDGRVQVDEYLHSVSDPRIFAAGDGAAVPGQRLSCQTALPQGAHAAANLARELDGRPPRPYSMGYTGQNVSLGRRNAVIQTAKRDDTPIRVWFGGRAGAGIKEAVCRAAKQVAATGRYTWLPAPR